MIPTGRKTLYFFDCLLDGKQFRSFYTMTYDVRKVILNEYCLFQTADLICALELLQVKTEHQDLSNSEKRIFH